MPNSSPRPDASQALRAWLEGAKSVFVLTGAGCSTLSGIPDYRDAMGAWKRASPVMFQAFAGDPGTYKRYWARSYVGWPLFSKAEPNPAHFALTGWQRRGLLSSVVTQNVDGLHQRAGSCGVIDLHGRLDEVICLSCDARLPRSAMQAVLTAMNPDWRASRGKQAPDGDADIDDEAVACFNAPRCEHCDGLLKPDVVFFGENVPRMRYLSAQEELYAADAVLVVGSSLMVYSGYRFVRMAHEAGMPIALLNRGRTRADDLATLKLDADCATTLTDALSA
ncbi:MAG: NAD-dependent protein deacetylase [Luteimonas sp.]